MESIAAHSGKMRRYPCRCCGFLTLSDPSNGSYEICAVCFWEDDPVQNEDPAYAGGANHVSLYEAQRNYVELGTAEFRCRAHVRWPSIEEAPLPPTLRGLDSEHRAVKERSVKIVLLGTMRSTKAGQISLLEGCGAISALAHPVNSEGYLSESLRPFECFTSETDDMPIGEAGRLWSVAALADKDAQIAEYEQRVRPSIMEACDQLEAVLLAELKA